MIYRNLAQMQRLQAERLGPAVALRYRRFGLYHDVSWQQYREMTEACAIALIDAGIRSGDRVGILAENRIEWLIADMAILAAGAVNVPPHAPLTARQVQFQLAETEVRWLFVSTLEQLDKIRQIAGELPNLEGIVVFDEIAAPLARATLRATAASLLGGVPATRPAASASGVWKRSRPVKRGSAPTTWPRSCTPPERPAIPRA